MSPYRIPLNRPGVIGRELEHIGDAVAQGHLSGDGRYTKACHEFLEQRIGVARALLTTSCTHALDMSALLLDIQPGDEVIVPSFTFVSTINAFVLRGARPVFVDVRPDTLNLNEELVIGRITPRTRAILPVHYAGVGCAMDALMQIAAEHGLSVVEDNAHGLFGSYRGKPLGTFGRLATQSFHETKNFGCGEGGALMINDPTLIERAEIIREKGTNRSRFFRGQVDKYTWVDIGSSYLPSELVAAFLYGQLEQYEQVQARRRRIWETYAEGLGDWAGTRQVRLPVVPDECQQAFHLFYMLLPSLETREALTKHLKARGILATFHYLPLHSSPMGQRFGGKPGDCPVTEEVSDRLLRLPFFFHLTDAEQAEVIAAIRDFRW